MTPSHCRFHRLRAIQRLRVEHRHRQVVVNQVFLRHFLNLSGGDRLEFFQACFQRIQWQSGGFYLADQHRLVEHRIALIDLGRDHLRLDTLQLLLGHAIPLDLLDLPAKCRFQLGNTFAFRWRSLQHEHRRPARNQVIPCPGRYRNLLFSHQRLIESRRGMTVQHAGQHLQRIGIAILSGIAQSGRVVAHGQVGQLGGSFNGHPFDAALIGFGLGFARR